MKFLQLAVLLLAATFAGCAYWAPGDTLSRAEGTSGDPYGVMPTEGGVQLIRNGLVVRTIRTSGSDVTKWGYTSSDRELVVKSRDGQGPAVVELFKVSDGSLQQKIPAGAIRGGQPGWAAAYAD